MTEHPVTLGDLRVFIDPPVTNAQQMVTTRWTRPATVADLVSALQAEGVLVIEKENIEDWPSYAINVVAQVVEAWNPDLNVYSVMQATGEVLDALAEAQPFPPAGGVS